MRGAEPYQPNRGGAENAVGSAGEAGGGGVRVHHGRIDIRKGIEKQRIKPPGVARAEQNAKGGESGYLKNRKPPAVTDGFLRDSVLVQLSNNLAEDEGGLRDQIVNVRNSGGIVGTFYGRTSLCIKVIDELMKFLFCQNVSPPFDEYFIMRIAKRQQDGTTQENLPQQTDRGKLDNH